jgi:hypothetical protein
METHLQEVEPPAQFLGQRVMAATSIGFVGSYVDDIEGQLRSGQYAAAFLSARNLLGLAMDLVARFELQQTSYDLPTLLAWMMETQTARLNVAQLVALLQANPVIDAEVQEHCNAVLAFTQETLASSTLPHWVAQLRANEDGSPNDAFAFTPSGMRWWWQRVMELTALADYLDIHPGADPTEARKRPMATREA